LTRGNLAARHADCARLVDQSGKKGWQKLDGPLHGQVHPGLIWQDAVRARRRHESERGTLFPWVPDSGWPLPLSKPMGWQNGGKKIDKAFRIVTPMRKASWTKRCAAGWGERRRAKRDSGSGEAG